MASHIVFVRLIFYVFQPIMKFYQKCIQLDKIILFLILIDLNRYFAVRSNSTSVHSFGIKGHGCITIAV